LIDKGDKEAEKITGEIIRSSIDFKTRIILVEVDDPPMSVNPKVYKMKHALPFLGKYTILLDDDAIIERDKFQQVFKYLKVVNCIITGIPCHRSAPGFFSNLVTAFVNGNSFFSYLPMAFISKPKTVSGSLCILETETLKKYDIFSKIERKLCDEYEIAQICKSNDIKIVQSTVPINMTISIKGIKQYVSLMKRWMVFVNDFLKQSISAKEFIIVVLPSILPALALTLSVLCGPIYTGIWIVVHIIKVLYCKAIRQRLIKKRESYTVILFEILAEYLQTLHFINALIFPRKIKWRDKIIRLSKDGTILVDRYKNVTS
jgi:ceramide glucosyltransferase